MDPIMSLDDRLKKWKHKKQKTKLKLKSSQVVIYVKIFRWEYLCKRDKIT